MQQQSLVRKLVTQTRNRFIFNSHSLRHTVLTSLPNHSQLCHHIPTSFLTRPLHPFHSHQSTLRNFLSNPLIIRLFSSNSRFLHCRPKLPTSYFYRQPFDFNQSSIFNQRAWRSWIHRLRPLDVVLGLIGANVAVFLLWRIADENFMINNFTISLDNIKSGRLHTVITNAFSHTDSGHIISNMIGLYFFGMNIGRNFGTEFLIKLYFAGAVGGAVFYLVHQAYKAQTSKLRWRPMELALGASAAVNAIMLLDIFLSPKATLYLDFIIPVPAILLGVYLIGKDMLRILEGDSHISGATHMGGAAVAAIAWARVRKGRF
ncbi:hypothetical protein Lal_00006108 [Lupinus albus]|uniref:Putative rhomboid protease n=1 Tax=Lupinus albus TaxID=3870 RepID=A0A6A4Q672_LUPAL|nr:putative rhomboid protease [Lupinus albus]KAF1875480.1 hypothetical protein Lal_00006108 [Lupinus albus]